MIIPSSGYGLRDEAFKILRTGSLGVRTGKQKRRRPVQTLSARFPFSQTRNLHKLFGTAPFCIRFVSSISGRGRVYQMGTNLDVKLRLSEINRKSAELSAVSSRLADMASQLNRLRKLNGRIGFLSGRNRPSSRRNDDSYTSRRELADSIIELVQPPSPVCYFSFILPRQFSARRTHRFYCRLKSQHWKVRQRRVCQGRRVWTLTRSTPVRRPRSLA